MMRETASRHFFRRRARRREQALTQLWGPQRSYRVDRASRGPFRWFVVRTR